MYLYRLERIVFGDPSDIISNITSGQDFVHSNSKKYGDDATVHIDINDDTGEHNTRPAWIDEDDQYSYVYYT